MMQQYIEKASVLIEAVPYIQDFSGSLVVVKSNGGKGDKTCDASCRNSSK